MLLSRMILRSNQSGKPMVYPSSFVWIEKESWALKNWCFWTVVLKQTLESPLDCKIKPVNPKGNQSWIVTGRTDAEAETPILWSWTRLGHWTDFICPHPLEPPSHLPPHPTLLGCPRAPVWAPWVMQQIPTGFCFTDGIAYVSMVLSPLIPPSPSHRHGEQTYGHGPGQGAVWEGESGKDF